jgi:DNA-binding MarR family transcriptional regulator
MAGSVPKRQNTVNLMPGPRRPRRTPAGDAFSWFAIQVIRLSGRLTAAGDALAKPVGQSSARWLVMAAVEDAPATVAQVSRLLGLTRQSVQRIADLLADDGLAVYEDNPGHRRAKLLSLTEVGRRTLATIQAAQATWANELGAEIGADGLRRTNEVLDSVLDLLTRRSPGSGSTTEASG